MSFSYDFDCISQSSLLALKSLSYSEKGTKRLCLHKDVNCAMQMMLIKIKKLTTYKSHAHIHSDEIVVLLEGKLNYKFESKVITLSKGNQISIIIKKGEFHEVESGENGAMFIEIIQGPFKSKNTTLDVR